MTISHEKLTEEDLINEFDDVVETHKGIQRNLWEGDCPKSLKEEIENLPKKVEFEELGNGKVRLEGGDIIEDLRNLDFITVDPKNCKDMDDAVCCEIAENGDYILYTAVADVPRYFDLPETLDDIGDLDSIGKVYLSGGYTMYSPLKAYSILPRELSDELCSLKEGEDRLAFVTKIVIDKDSGKQKGEPQIMEGVIKSRAKLSYNTAQEIIDNKDMKIKIFSKKVDTQVITSQLVADAIRLGFKKRDMVRFVDEKETRISINDGKIEVEREDRIAFQDVIEAFMIMTNEANARFAFENGLDVIYRVHDAPDANADGNDICSLIRLLNKMPLFGFDEGKGLETSSQVTPGTFNKIFDIVSKNDGEKNETYRKFLERIQTRAKSSVDPKQTDQSDGSRGREYKFSHFGLQSEYYMHITSPIRRITDYVNMKNILAFVQEKKPLSKDLVSQIARQADERRDEVDKATFEFDNVVAGHYYKDNQSLVEAKVVDFDYSKNGYCIFEDEKTGFRINVPLEFYTNGSFVDQEKWGALLYGNPVVTLGKKEKLLVNVNKRMEVEGIIENKSIRCDDSKDCSHHEEEQTSRKKDKYKDKHKYKDKDRNKYKHKGQDKGNNKGKNKYQIKYYDDDEDYFEFEKK